VPHTINGSGFFFESAKEEEKDVEDDDDEDKDEDADDDEDKDEDADDDEDEEEDDAILTQVPALCFYDKDFFSLFFPTIESWKKKSCPTFRRLSATIKLQNSFAMRFEW
jgi:hypothetical protein